MDPRNYDIEHYVRLLRDSFAVRLARAFTQEDFAAVFADPDQPSLFQPLISDIHTVLTALPHHRTAGNVDDDASDA
jgi:DNA polymerase, archaea type